MMEIAIILLILFIELGIKAKNVLIKFPTVQLPTRYILSILRKQFQTKNHLNLIV